MKTINEISQVSSTCVLRFSAAWCGPCRVLKPIMDEIIEENPSIESFVVDCDESKDLPTKYQVRNIPTTIFIKDGEVIDRLVGVNPKEVIQAKYDLLKD